MANLTITAGSVVSRPGSKKIETIAGAPITAGQPVVRDPATDKYVLADSNHATVALRLPKGIALNSASDGQPLLVHTDGPITIGATVVPGTDYWLSDTPGAICPRADVGSGETAVFLGLATSASVIDINIQNSGVQL